eukprot:Gb_34748 [translate_table: standard]
MLMIDHAMQNTEDAKLERILSKAAMPDKTVILTTLNRAWATPNSMIDLFLESFRIGDGISSFMDHLVIVALDQKAYDRCLSIHVHCFVLKTEGVDFSGEKFFMTDDYLKMMWRRISFLGTVLEMGYNFVFTDADIMWFRDPFQHFARDADFQIACDHFTGSPLNLDNRPNGGFNYVKSNNRTIEFYKYWYMSREVYPGNHDQDVLNIIKYDVAITEMGLTMRFLDTAYFGGLCELSHDFNKVCTMHANCCYGLNNKLHDLRLVLEDWRHFQSMTVKEKRVQPFTWRAPRHCRFVCSIGRSHSRGSGREDKHILHPEEARVLKSQLVKIICIYFWLTSVPGVTRDLQSSLATGKRLKGGGWVAQIMVGMVALPVFIMVIKLMADGAYGSKGGLHPSGQAYVDEFTTNNLALTYDLMMFQKAGSTNMLY